MLNKSTTLSCTYKVSKSFGLYDAKTEEWSGAIGQLQREEIQLLAIPVYYPVLDPDEKFFAYSWPFHEDRMMIVCAYNSSYNKIEVDVINMFTSIRYELWLAVLMAFTTFVILLSFGYAILGITKRYKSPLWMVTSAFLFEDNFPDDTTFNKAVNVCACVFLFFFGAYLMNGMSSDLVVYIPPPTIASYADAIEWRAQGHKLSVMMVPALPETEKFASSDPATPEGQLYAMKSDMFEDAQLSIAVLLSKLTKPIVNMEMIVIMREDMMKAVTAWVLNTVSSMDSFKDYKALLNVDQHSQRYSNVIAFSKSLPQEMQTMIRKS